MKKPRDEENLRGLLPIGFELLIIIVFAVFLLSFFLLRTTITKIYEKTESVKNMVPHSLEEKCNKRCPRKE